MLPLHFQVGMEGAQVAVTEVLLSAYPNAVKEQDINGHTPLHWAVMQDTRPGMNTPPWWEEGIPSTAPMVATVLRASPEAAFCFDVEGNLPLHCAAADNAPIDVLKMLIDVNPRAGQLLTGAGDYRGDGDSDDECWGCRQC